MGHRIASKPRTHGRPIVELEAEWVRVDRIDPITALAIAYQRGVLDALTWAAGGRTPLEIPVRKE